MGEPGLKTFLKAFFCDQLRAQEPKPYVKEDRVQARRRMRWLVAWSCSLPAVFYVFSPSNWPKTFIISASIMGVTLILFLLGIRVYRCKESAGHGRRLPIFSVFKASLLKWKLDYPTSPNHFFRNDENQLCLSPRIKILRRLDKSAIVESSNLSPEEQRNAGRLCTVREVKEIKLLFKMIPLWINFVVLGLLVSTGDTFFPEQGNNLNDDADLCTVLLIIRSISPIILGFLLKLVVRNWDTKTKKQAQILKIWAGMMLSVFCCAVAWRVEVHRLNIVNKEGLQYKPDDVIPMSIFWLAPQFILLGLTQALASDGLNEFVTYEFPESTQKYVKSINEFVIGIGSFLNILCVHANGSLFSDTLNLSRLDKYYKTLTVVSFINFCSCFLFISTIYASNEGRVAVDEFLQTSDAADAV
ncbi:protein NRT1/ PTR FAMILY 5.5-like isoform X2 [Mangifera indica]|nr:protein NRT1/ PTR FAMILY 5.5-like isoform X2 [Mangifera indica]XP_044497786.1 protein NRT1/ PTR FAMILY 5.5-like isoform X2 [Mangifera indica]XP_044497787.1 protein NRT1/ PTR FAMILY 5.5-like isoform X2 [Mangifera indica]XP_044497788.1 protein NRT1/ PTR FAMILY 5.5-like isoform X2 [Mangifera indica]XP_044497789.1 protein NRT1/ PTR FAMILY 5.5-like isoform X2 [Mangifera indica]